MGVLPVTTVLEFSSKVGQASHAMPDWSSCFNGFNVCPAKHVKPCEAAITLLQSTWQLDACPSSFEALVSFCRCQMCEWHLTLNQPFCSQRGALVLYGISILYTSRSLKIGPTSGPGQ